jgi:hypothetical protein
LFAESADRPDEENAAPAARPNDEDDASAERGMRGGGGSTAAAAAASLPLLGIGGGFGRRRNGNGGCGGPSSLSSSSSSSSYRGVTFGRSSSSSSSSSSSTIGGRRDRSTTFANPHGCETATFGAESEAMDVATPSDAVVGVDAPREGSGEDGDGDATGIVRERADWYDPEEFATMEKEAAAASLGNGAAEGNDAGDGVRRAGSRTGRRAAGGVNDNFVRLDMRNSAGSCRGARNLKRANKHKLWRAQHRFGMSDSRPPGGDRAPGDAANDDDDDDDDDDDGDGGGTSGSIYQRRERSSRRGSAGGKGDFGDLKCFSSAKNAGVDPLDDFVDGVYSSTKKNDGRGGDASSSSRKGGEKRKSATRTRDESVPLCTRHQRPCKLLTVKRNNKGNRGRKFYVCCMPKGEQCDFFKWEEDTVEVRWCNVFSFRLEMQR